MSLSRALAEGEYYGDGSDLPIYSFCYSRTWFECHDMCTSAGWTMLCVENAKQNEYIYGETGVETWLGYTDSSEEGRWEWTDGCLSNYTNWAGEEPNSWGGDEDYAVLCPTYYAAELGWCDWGMGEDRHLCVCQTDDATLEKLFPQEVECSDAAQVGHGLGIAGWTHWLTFHAGNNGLKALDKENDYRWNRSRAFLLHLTLILSIVMLAGGSLIVDKCGCYAGLVDHNLGITYIVFGIWGFLWTGLALILLQGKGVEEPAPAPAVVPRAVLPPAVELGPAPVQKEQEELVSRLDIVLQEHAPVAEKELAPTTAIATTVGGGARVVPEWMEGLSLVEKLQEIKGTLEAGLISEAEAAQLKQLALSSLTSGPATTETHDHARG